MKNRLPVILTSTALGLAWLFPAEHISAVLGWLCVFGLVWLVDTKQYLKNSYLAGVIALIVGFYWIPYTVQVFGGFNTIASYAVLLLFATVSAFQFIIYAYLANFIRARLNYLSVSCAIAWLVSELLWIRIFPWEPAHTQLSFIAFTQIADIAGTSLITFIMFWVAEAILIKPTNKYSLVKITPLAVLVLCLSYGFYKIKWYENLTAEKQAVALVQANISTEEKHNVTLFKKNTERYQQLTDEIIETADPSTIVIWPESVVLDWIPDETRLLSDAPQIPRFLKETALITGALTFNTEEQNFNSAVAVYANGQIPKPYHKRVLLPFGEYMPGSSWFPWIQDFNPMARGFTAGTDATVFKFPLANGKTANFAPLICYEDVLPELSRKAVQSGAQVIVNLTNDAWFGKSKAPFQHNLIASFRAIENQRFLLRATNSGMTAVINPLGQIVAELPVFSDGQIQADVLLLDQQSLFTKYFANNLRYLCLLLLVGLFFLKKAGLRDDHFKKR